MKPQTTAARRIAERVDPLDGLNAADRERQSMFGYIRAAVSPDDYRDAGVHREISDHLGGDGHKVRMPSSLLFGSPMAAAVGTGSSGAGAELVFERRGAFIEHRRPKARVFDLGARFLPNLAAPTSFPKQTGAETVYWVGEAPGSDVTESNITTDLVALERKTLSATVAYTAGLVFQTRGTSADVEEVSRDSLRETAGVAVDAAAINGSGTGNEPEGILNTSGVAVVAGGANGAVPTWDNILDLEYQVGVDDADFRGAQGYISTPGIRKKLKQVEKSTGSGFIWDGNQMNGYRAEASTNVPSNLTKGTATNAHALIFGAWDQLIVAEFGFLEVVVDPYAQKKQGIIEATLQWDVAIAVRHAEAFATMQDALTA